MKILPTVALTLIVTFAACAQDATPKTQTSAWEQRLAEHHQKLVDANGPGTNASLRAELLSMGAEDQRVRGMVNGAPVNKDKLEFSKNITEVDRALTARLKKMVPTYGWPTIELVGYEASNSAMLILNHSPDHEWQRSLLPTLEQLATDEKIDGSSLAAMIDKELVSEGKPQRYGNNFKLVQGKMQQFAVEDPEHLDERRARMYLMPMDVYEQMMSEMYHIAVLPGFAEPTPPAPTK